MTIRFARFACAPSMLVFLAAAPTRAQGVEYPAGNTTYRIKTVTQGTQTSPMGSASFDLSLQEQISVNVMRHAKDTIMATMTLDSIALKASAGPMPDLTKIIGARFVSLLSPTGKFYSSKAPEGIDPALAQITEGIGHLLPVYRGNIANGSTWSDTTSGKVMQQGMEMNHTTISSYKVEGDTTIGGEKAFLVQRVTTSKAVGSGSMQGTPMTMETAGNSTGAFYISRKGAFLGATSKDEIAIKILVVAQNMEINIKQNALTTAEAIR